MAGHKSSTNVVPFFAIIGFLGMVFGSCIALFNLEYSPVESAILSVLFIIIGGVCSMFALAKSLDKMDEALFSAKKENNG